MKMPHRAKVITPGSKEHFDPPFQSVGDELIVISPRTDRVHLLPREVAQVYLACDGQSPPEQVIYRLGLESEQLLASCLQQLEEAQLIVSSEDDVSRRQFLLGATLSAVAITSVILPVPAAAASCLTGSSGCPTTFGSGCTIACCSTSSFSTCSCPGGCAGCKCMIEFECRNSSGVPVPCGTVASGTLGACSPGTTDVIIGRTCGNTDFSAPINFSCASARASAAGLGTSNYYCCQCP